ncbi:glycosyl transferase group 1 [Pseudopedobacter saltans DSM 12145]|uniref:Glycosyl transferase group 1 n=1 Tax=Pseudopedobacter saltans (strain ATCC 51119 / DSM 12145 / JCM 21818 / CCUG 39354 / LMG 10337 / NBRC 100064 / NCIMB 13643) TaxID=762903 RepID=F0SDD5_PSESL|nr:glycosyltransferase family 4 protein [Pseudopedobacter saltans]ADY53918.1 glycosyl transferase group 1 [Pseudopedobacter saltans DSM 12145]
MRVLLLSNRIPFPPHGGYAIVVYNTIQELLSLGCEVTLFSLNTAKHYVFSSSIQDELIKKIKFYKYGVDDKVKVKDAFFNLFTSKSYNIIRFYSEGCAGMLAKILRENDFDIVQFEGLQVTPYLETVRNNSNAKVVYRSHNIEFKIWKRLALKEGMTPKKLYLNLLSKRLREYETNIINKFDALFAISHLDEHFFKSIGCTSVLTSFPVALNLSQYAGIHKLTPHKSIGYIGSMDWRPNVEGLSWFLEQVWPQIQKLTSGIKFHLAGKNMPARFTHRDFQNYVMEGEVDDALEFISKQHVFVVPLFSGSGMRVKIIEAMALGKCVIATSIAAEGIKYQHDKNILIADRADDFYKQILRCFTDKTLISRIGKQARLLVQQHHDIEKESKRMLLTYQKLCAK